VVAATELYLLIYSIAIITLLLSSLTVLSLDFDVRMYHDTENSKLKRYFSTYRCLNELNSDTFMIHTDFLLPIK